MEAFFKDLPVKLEVFITIDVLNKTALARNYIIIHCLFYSSIILGLGTPKLQNDTNAVLLFMHFIFLEDTTVCWTILVSNKYQMV